jgi:hypothetical protein
LTLASHVGLVKASPTLRSLAEEPTFAKHFVRSAAKKACLELQD